jgi:chromosome segregation ATPase
MLRSSRQAKEAARLADDKDVESAQREEERVRRHLETLAVESEQIDEERADAGGRLAEVEVELGAARERERALDLELGELSAALDADREAEGASWRM